MMRGTATVGLLDFGVANEGESARDIVADTVRAAKRADELGFARYWLAEHQVGACRWASPELVLALIARETTRIRVGSGGLLFSTHNALRVASDFTLLAQLYPDRVDLGLARGLPGENQLALLEPVRVVASSVDEFATKVVALLGYLRGIPRPQHAYMHAQTFPAATQPPDVWLLGTGGASGALAARYGLPFALSLLHTRETSLASLAAYYRDFRPSASLAEPRALLAFAGVCAETEARARTAAAAQPNRTLLLSVVGTARDWCERAAELMAAAGVHELLYLDVSPRAEQRLVAYELLAELLGSADARAP